VRDGLEARVTRSVYYELAELAEPGPHPGAGGIGVWSEGAFFTLQDSDR
jgi:hypothetical protein